MYLLLVINKYAANIHNYLHNTSKKRQKKWKVAQICNIYILLFALAYQDLLAEKNIVQRYRLQPTKLPNTSQT